MEKFSEFLREIAPYVVVVGSFARHAETEASDIDCFLRSRPVAEVDCEIGNDTYMPEVLAIIKRYDFVTDSVLVGHIAVERQRDVPRMVEISSHYRIPHTEPVFVREICGVHFLCARDNKDAAFEECYDSADWDDEAGDMVIKYPLAKFVETKAK